MSTWHPVVSLHFGNLLLPNLGIVAVQDRVEQLTDLIKHTDAKRVNYDVLMLGCDRLHEDLVELSPPKI